jgi:hypothetical protein
MLIGFMGPEDTNKSAVVKELRTFTDIVPLPHLLDQLTSEQQGLSPESLRLILDMYIDQLNSRRSGSIHYLTLLTPADFVAVMRHFDDLDEATFFSATDEYKEAFEADARKAMEHFQALFIFEPNTTEHYLDVKSAYIQLLQTCRDWDLEVTMVETGEVRDQAEFVGLACGIPLA